MPAKLEVTGIETSSTTAAAELRYERATSGIELLAQGEVLRKLRFRNCLMGDEIAELNDKLFEEAERGDEAEFDVLTWKANADEANEKLERTLNELRFRTRELDNLRTELMSFQSISADSTKLLTEKLNLSRELANLKPELEHLRSHASANQGTLAEKLSLQRQLCTVQAELENEKKTLHRLTAKQGKSGEQNAQYEAQIEELRRDLAKEQRERQKAERAATKFGEEQLDEIKKDLAKEKRDREKAEKATGKANEEQLEELRKELTKEKREREKAEKSSSKLGDDRQDEMKKELAREKRERLQAEKEASKADAEWKTQKAVLDDKLDQFRTKLRTTKEKLKETEAELLSARTAAVTRSSAVEPKAKNPRKRAVAQMDPDAAIGTPGDAGPAKRGKRASSVVGEKSTFSITPFLNRTTSVAPASPMEQHISEHDDDEEPIQSVETAASPSTSRAKPAPIVKKTVPALAPVSASKNNAKAAPGARKKVAAGLTLEKVTEEGEASGEDAENEPPIRATSMAAHDKGKAPRPSMKPKSLSSFASFREGSLPPQQMKKRKLLGGVGKTLFDDEDDADGAAGGKAGFGGQRAFGAFGGRGFGGISLMGAKKIVVAEDGFAFSPLKKDRKAMAGK